MSFTAKLKSPTLLLIPLLLFYLHYYGNAYVIKCLFPLLQSRFPNTEGISFYILNTLVILELFLGFLLLKNYYPDLLHLKKVKIPSFILILGLIGFLFYWQDFATHLSFFKRHPSGNSPILIENTWTLSIVILQYCFLGPIIEEVIFRGLWMGVYFKKSTFYLDVIISGFCFAVSHFLNIGWQDQLFILYFPFGIVLGLILRMTKCLYWTILIHILINARAFEEIFVYWYYLFLNTFNL